MISGCLMNGRLWPLERVIAALRLGYMEDLLDSFEFEEYLDSAMLRGRPVIPNDVYERFA